MQASLAPPAGSDWHLEDPRQEREGTRYLHPGGDGLGAVHALCCVGGVGHGGRQPLGHTADHDADHGEGPCTRKHVTTGSGGQAAGSGTHVHVAPHSPTEMCLEVPKMK